MDIYRKISSNKNIGKWFLIISIGYSVFLVIFSWNELKELDSSKTFSILSYGFALYFLSFLFQLSNWLLIINSNRSRIMIDLRIYFKTVLMRRLPGGIWQFVGRVKLYKENDLDTIKSTTAANIYEWCLLLFSGLMCYLIFRGNWWGITIAPLIIIAFTLFQIKKGSRPLKTIIKLIAIIILNVSSYILGGLLLFYLLKNLNPFAVESIQSNISKWSLTSTLSSLFFFIPSGIVIKEFSLIGLLGSTYSIAEIFLLSLQLRLFFLLYDLIISLSSLQIIYLLTKKHDTLTQ